MLDVTPYFTRPDGTYTFARWRRPLVPVIFGLADESLPIFKGAIEAVAAIARHGFAETDPEQGANLMIFVLRDWAELEAAPEIAELIPEITAALPRLIEQDARSYRLFRFETDGAIRACFAFLRVTGADDEPAAEDLALDQAVRAMLTFGAGAAPQVLASSGGGTVVHPDIAAILRAAYDPVLPDAAGDASHALRLSARAAR
ncbi:hypothetical protein [Ketogulonicigenium vulgare]|uniref:Uncharacterized protein n=1 Tax=Ketogulonicigenium vulgare (strain WSH-001) TaxID=759362 RepID=F9YAK9_KETVW|nr:hypothetical protein [Ketogulonicigenium vulgare]ADO43246.1 conserved hypothetical protein [Ketogulonicigenium vulgare Y25]AEM41540.1 hypothetical protein KVU_1701 [Ketogulonicigenium vulgare WSH-001]ALJ81661.1 hypothetical protein KVH_11070 [Ketogulonicigenium vulgare]ANW34331.1 hypothetical protein KvSKV_10985 [Ketogulonicigenium vulgare]AOZ55282.1 hypothetical protein KVC_2277 [Ketogulonicigenium vulgare]